IDGQSQSFDVMEINRPDGLGDIANVGLTLAEAKQILARVQQELVAAQADNHTTLRPDCRSCGGRCHVKDWRLRIPARSSPPSREGTKCWILYTGTRGRWAGETPGLQSMREAPHIDPRPNRPILPTRE